MKRRGEVRRVIVGLIHGGHAIVDSAPTRRRRRRQGRSRFGSEMVQEPELAELDLEETLAVVGTTDFDFLFPELVGDPDASASSGCGGSRHNSGGLERIGQRDDRPRPPADLRIRQSHRSTRTGGSSSTMT